MYNLNYVVNFVKADLDESTTSMDKKILQYALHGYRHELKLKTEKKISVAYLTINDAFQAPLPLDFSRYTKIGVICNGRVITLSVNEDLALQNIFDDCGDVTIDALNSCSCSPISGGQYPYGYYFAPHFRNGRYVGEMYGQRGGFNGRGYYKIFKEQGLIQFDINFPKFTYVLEYVSDGSADTGLTIIDFPSVDALRKYCHWQLVAYGKTPSLSFTQMKKDEFYFALKELQWIIHAPTVDEWLDASYGAYMSGPKR